MCFIMSLIVLFVLVSAVAFVLGVISSNASTWVMYPSKWYSLYVLQLVSWGNIVKSKLFKGK